MIYKTVFTDRRLIEMRKSNGIRHQLNEEKKASLGTHSMTNDATDWRDGLKDLPSNSETGEAA